MKLKSKKSALLLSFTSLLLCFAMLAGSTFAWFTDTATTGVNKIVSGKLDVDIVDAADTTKSLDKQTLKWVRAKSDTEKEAVDSAEILWEPGCTYQLQPFMIANKGNLALKYKIQITGIQGDAKLNEVIEWKINDQDINLTEKHLLAGTANNPTYSEPITISGHMKKEAGNEYQNLTIDGIAITVYATQLNSEFDSFNNTYDKDAEYVMRNATIMSETDGKTFTLEAGKTYTVGSATVEVSVNGDIAYTNTDGTAQTVTINTEGGKLTVNAPKDTVNHHGEAEFVEITAIAGNSYHEFGKVSVLAITKGRAVIENGNNAAITQLKGEDALVVVREGVMLETKLEQASGVTAKVGVINADGNAIESKTVEVKEDVENVPAELQEVLGSGKTIGEAKDYVAMIGTDGYESLADAVAAAQDGATIKLLKNCSGNGIQILTPKFATKGLTVDFGGHSYTVGGVLVGSATTGTNAFQLLQGNKVTFQNGSIIGVAENTKPAEDTPDWHGAPAIVIQNYCDLTLKRMTVKGGDETVYTMSNNNGNVVIEDSTIIAGLAKETRYGPFAFDVCRYSSYPSVRVTVKGNSVIEGDVEVSGTIGEGQNRQLTIENGTFNGTFKVSNAPANITIHGGSFTDLANAIKYAADGATIGLAEDIDLSADYWTPLDLAKELTIDGNNHVISGLKTQAGILAPKEGSVPGDGHNCYYYAGFIGRNTKPLTVKNLTLKNANVEITSPEGVEENGSSSLAVVCGYNGAAITIENVVIDNCRVAGMQKIGGFVGQGHAKQVTIRNSMVKDSTFEGYFFVAPIAAYADSTKFTVENVIASNNTLKMSFNTDDSEVKDEAGNIYSANYKMLIGCQSAIIVDRTTVINGESYDYGAY